MSTRITLRPRTGVTEALDVEGLSGDRLAVLSESEIAQLPVWHAGRRASLGDFFEVRGGQAADVLFEGSVAHVHGIATAMTGGDVLIEGDAGNGVAADMTGGRVEVRGAVGHEAGAGMGGGALLIGGDAGDRLGAARPGAQKGMTGGEIVVRGSAGVDAGAACRRGLIAVMGDVGADAARSMVAGSVLVAGRCGHGAGRFNKRGSVIAIGGIEVPATYRYACTFRPPHLRVTLIHLMRRYDLSFAPTVLHGRFRRFCGDLVSPGKGEILVWDAP